MPAKHKTRIDDDERRLWVVNDEGLYRTMLSDFHTTRRRNVNKWIRENRPLIDEVICNVLDNKKPAHYLTYGG